MSEEVGQDHESRAIESRLIGAIVLNALIVVAEIVGGLISGSLALLSDAIHNLSDVAALTIAWVARGLGRRPPSQRHTYGLGRVEVLAALFNSATILVMGTLIIRSAVMRLMHPVPVLGGVMLVVASVGLAANLVSVLLLKGHSHGDLNMRAAVLHLLQDTLSSVAVVVAALLSGRRYGTYLDPAVSILVVILVLFSGLRLLRDAGRVLLEGTPAGLDLQALQADVQELVPNCGLHHIHVWELRPDQRILTAHVRLCDDMLLSKLEVVLQQVRDRLQSRWAIAHSTLEPEIVGCGKNDLLGEKAASKTNICSSGACGSSI
jgi:cobalt-zinc-cadmium efflux system protein